tara:strand:+ start:412 stop:738 length:327 start_codon:yes stop_codon:yes gene_type:complete
MAWIAKNNPDWEQFDPPTNDPDPQWEMAKRGDKDALMLEMEYLAGLVDSIAHKAEVLQRTIHDLRDGLERHSSPDTSGDTVAGDLVSGGLRVPANIRGECDHPPTEKQ